MIQFSNEWFSENNERSLCCSLETPNQSILFLFFLVVVVTLSIILIGSIVVLISSIHFCHCAHAHLVIHLYLRKVALLTSLPHLYLVVALNLVCGDLTYRIA